jgi:hypothetical protein
MFDNLIILAEGKMMYQGDAEESIDYFKKLGYPCPKRSNPADFFFYRILNNEETEMPVFEPDDLVGASHEMLKAQSPKPVTAEGSELVVDTDLSHHGNEAEGLRHRAISNSNIASHPVPRRESLKNSNQPTNETNQERITRLLSLWSTTPHFSKVQAAVSNPASGGIPHDSYKAMASPWIQFSYLIQRESKNAYRNPLIFRQRLMQTLFISVFIGLIYLRGRESSEEQKRQNIMGVLFFMAINGVFSTSQVILTLALISLFSCRKDMLK